MTSEVNMNGWDVIDPKVMTRDIHFLLVAKFVTVIEDIQIKNKDRGYKVIIIQAQSGYRVVIRISELGVLIRDVFHTFTIRVSAFQNREADILDKVYEILEGRLK